MDSIEFTDETISSLIELGGVLRGIHDRLISEGYVIKEGSIEPPAHKDKKG